MKTTTLKNLCNRICKFDERWSFRDYQRESSFYYLVATSELGESHSPIITSNIHSKYRRYEDMLLRLGSIRKLGDKWTASFAKNIPEFSSLEELAIILDICGY